ncbi:MAG: response regulator transcription factor [Clostridiales bacterium]|nr:response regulator transcription factor [Clostridiales bacterium]
MPDKKTILLVEDNEQLNLINKRAFIRAGYRTVIATNIVQAKAYLEAEIPDVIILDIMLPDGSGVEFCREIRKSIAAPILFLTAVSGYEQTLDGLEAGGDDYLNKPFDMKLLLAKVAAFLRRDKIADGIRLQDNLIKAGPITLDAVAMRASIDGRGVSLSQKEFSLLLLLTRNAGTVLADTYLYESVWKQPMIANDLALRSMISRLRRKLEGSGYEILSVRDKGYRFDEIPPA